MGKFIHGVRITIHCRTGAAFALGREEPNGRTFRTAIPAMEPVLVAGDSAELVPTSNVSDSSPWLPSDLAEPLRAHAAGPRTHAKGEDVTDDARATARCQAASIAIGTVFNPPQPTASTILDKVRDVIGGPAQDELADLLTEMAGVHFEHGTPIDRAVADIKSKLPASSAKPVRVWCEKVYRDGWRAPWAHLAGAVEEAHETARRAREEEQEAARARAAEEARTLEVAISDVHPSVDFVLVADTRDALDSAADRIKFFFARGANAFRQGRRTCVAVENDGIRPDADGTLAHGISILRADRFIVRGTRAELAGVLPVHALDSERSWLADLVNERREIDTAILVPEAQRNLKDVDAWFAREQARAEISILVRRAMLARDYNGHRARVRLVDAYRKRGLEARMAKADIRDAAAQAWLDLTPEPAHFAAEEKRKTKSVQVLHAGGEQSRYVARTWDEARPAAPWIELDALVDEVYAGEHTEWSPGCVIESPPTPWRDRFFAACPSIDPLRSKLQEFLAGKPHARGEEIERLLFGRTAKPTERQRIHALMLKEGWSQSRISEGGKEVRAWVPAKPGERDTSEMRAAASAVEGEVS